MKSNGTTTILNWALAVVVVATTWGAVQYYFKTREARAYQMLITEFSQYQNKQAIINNLVSETMEYSKTHPAIDPILEAVGAKQGKSAVPAAPKPPAK